MSMNIREDQCFCTILAGGDEIKPDPFCLCCQGTGKIAKTLSLYEKLLKEGVYETEDIGSAEES